MEKIKSIIFDLGNVVLPIVKCNVYEAIQKASKIPGLEHILKNGINTNMSPQGQDLITRYEKGISTVQFWNSMAKQLKEPSLKDKNLIEKIEEIWCSTFQKIDEHMLELINNLKNKYNLVILSNIIAPHKDYILKNYSLNDLFDYIFLSCDLGMKKPEKEIFEFVLSKINAKPYEAIFIDDKEENIKTAKELGINAFLFSSVNDLKNKLIKFNIYV